MLCFINGLKFSESTGLAFPFQDEKEHDWLCQEYEKLVSGSLAADEKKYLAKEMLKSDFLFIS